MRLEYRRSPLRDVVIYSDGQLLREASVVRPAVFAEFVSNQDVATWPRPCGFWATQEIDSYGTLVAVKEGVTVRVIDERLWGECQKAHSGVIGQITDEIERLGWGVLSKGYGHGVSAAFVSNGIARVTNEHESRTGDAEVIYTALRSCTRTDSGLFDAIDHCTVKS